jgi:hypothetical protein
VLCWLSCSKIAAVQRPLHLTTQLGHATSTHHVPTLVWVTIAVALTTTLRPSWQRVAAICWKHGRAAGLYISGMFGSMHVLIWWAAQVTLHKPHRTISKKAQGYVYFACCSPLQHFAASQLRGGCCCSLRHARSTWKHFKPTLCCDGAYACAQ